MSVLCIGQSGYDIIFSIPERLPENIKLRITDKVEKIYLVSPELDDSVYMPFIQYEDCVEVVIPGGYFSGYAAIVFDT